MLIVPAFPLSLPSSAKRKCIGFAVVVSLFANEAKCIELEFKWVSPFMYLDVYAYVTVNVYHSKAMESPAVAVVIVFQCRVIFT